MNWSAVGGFATQLIWVSLVFGFATTAINEAKGYDRKPTWREVRTSAVVTLVLWIPNAIICYIVFAVVFGVFGTLLWLLSLVI